MENIESIISQNRHVSCDGSKGADGHPLVYLYIAQDNSVTCPYCSREFHFLESS